MNPFFEVPLQWSYWNKAHFFHEESSVYDVKFHLLIKFHIPIRLFPFLTCSPRSEVEAGDVYQTCFQNQIKIFKTISHLIPATNWLKTACAWKIELIIVKVLKAWLFAEHVHISRAQNSKCRRTIAVFLFSNWNSL